MARNTMGPRKEFFQNMNKEEVFREMLLKGGFFIFPEEIKKKTPIKDSIGVLKLDTIDIVETKRINRHFLAGVLSSKIAMFWFKSEGFSRKSLTNFPVICPGKPIQEIIGNLVDYIVYLESLDREGLFDFPWHETRFYPNWSYFVAHLKNLLSYAIFELYFGSYATWGYFKKNMLYRTGLIKNMLKDDFPHLSEFQTKKDRDAYLSEKIIMISSRDHYLSRETYRLRLYFEWGRRVNGDGILQNLC